MYKELSSRTFPDLPVQQAHTQVRERATAQFLVHFESSFELVFFVFLDHRVHDVDLVTGLHLLADEFPDLSRAIIRHPAGDDGSATGRHLVNDAEIEVTI